MKNVRELRNFAYDEIRKVVYITQAYQGNSSLLRYDASSSPPSLASFKLEKTCVHPYGLALGGEDVYVSCQDTKNVVRYDAGEFSDTENTADRRVKGKQVYNTTSLDPRAVAFSDVIFPGQSLLFVADRDTSSVIVLDVNKYTKTHTINLNDPQSSHKQAKPIGVAVQDGDPWSEPRVFVGDETSGKVFVFQRKDDSFEQVWAFHSEENLSHPAGLSIHNNLLYVACQKKKHVITFDLTDPDQKPTVVIKSKHLPNDFSDSPDFSESSDSPDSDDFGPEGILVLDDYIQPMTSAEQDGLRPR